MFTNIESWDDFATAIGRNAIKVAVLVYKTDTEVVQKIRSAMEKSDDAVVPYNYQVNALEHPQIADEICKNKELEYPAIFFYDKGQYRAVVWGTSLQDMVNEILAYPLSSLDSTMDRYSGVSWNTSFTK